MNQQAVLVESQAAERRSGNRRILTLTVDTELASEKWASVVIRNISDEGLLLQSEAAELEVGDTIRFDMPGRGMANATVVWADETLFGCKLDEKFSSAELATALLKSDPAEGASAGKETSDALEGFADPFYGRGINFPILFVLAGLAWAMIGLVIYLIM